MKSESEVAQSCMTLSDPMDCSLPGSSIHGIFQATVLEWAAIAFSRNLGHKYINLGNTVVPFPGSTMALYIFVCLVFGGGSEAEKDTALLLFQAKGDTLGFCLEKLFVSLLLLFEIEELPFLKDHR